MKTPQTDADDKIISANHLDIISAKSKEVQPTPQVSPFAPHFLLPEHIKTVFH